MDEVRRNSNNTVLLAEDDELVRILLACSLRRAGLQVLEAGDGLEALQILRRSGDLIDLLVSDVEMPAMSGIELAQLASAGAALPVILISGSMKPPDVDGNSWKFLSKPFLPDLLLRTVQEALAIVPAEGSPAGDDCDGACPGLDPPVPRLRVILAEDDGTMRDRLCKLLGTEYNIVGAFPDGGAVLDQATDLQPDLFLLDISMPGMSGFTLADLLRHRLPSVPVIFVTQHSDQPYIDRALRNGVAGYVLKRNVVGELSAAMQQVYRGSTYVSPCLCQP